MIDSTQPENKIPETTAPQKDPIAPPLAPFSPSLAKKEFFSNTWRNGVAFLLLVMSASLTLFFLHNQNSAWQAFEAWAHLDIAGFLQKHTFQPKGGDISVSPPPLPPPPIPKLVGTLPDVTQFTAGSMLVKDRTTGEVLFQKNEYERRPIASLSKLMSALVLLEKDMDWKATTTVKVEKDMADSHFLNGEVYTLQDIWEAALVGSSNQAVLSLVDAVYMSRDAFVARMNEKAMELGMKDSQFVEPTGLSEQNVSTASDVVLLLDESLKSEKIQETLLLKETTISPVGKKKPHHIWSTNWLLLGWVPNKIVDFRGGKTGYITAAGYNFAMQIAENDAKVIDVVILGAAEHEDRFSEARDIGKSVFAAFKWPSDEMVSSTASSTPE